MIFDAIENSDYYVGLGEKFKTAFDFLKTTDFNSIKEDRIDIDGDNIYALINNYETKDPEDCDWERHEKYIDIQYMVSGAENIGFVLSDYLDVKTEYNEEKDVEILKGDGDYVQLSDGEFVVFFPDDAHMPGLIVEKKETIQKVVVKIKI